MREPKAAALLHGFASGAAQKAVRGADAGTRDAHALAELCSPSPAEALLEMVGHMREGANLGGAEQRGLQGGRCYGDRAVGGATSYRAANA